MGITCLDGQPLLCVVLITGKKRVVLVELGVDWQKLTTIDENDINELEDYEFFKKYYGGDEVLPGGPVCMFKGKEVPAFIKFTDSGGIDGETLREIFERIDSLEIYDEDRKNGLTPFALLDGHQSRFDLGFLRYINSPDTKWNVCIGVPYGTSIWQVGDSSEQNGTFKMSLNVEKKKYSMRDWTRSSMICISSIQISYLWFPKLGRMHSVMYHKIHVQFPPEVGIPGLWPYY